MENVLDARVADFSIKYLSHTTPQTSDPMRAELTSLLHDKGYKPYKDGLQTKIQNDSIHVFGEYNPIHNHPGYFYVEIDSMKGFDHFMEGYTAQTTALPNIKGQAIKGALLGLTSGIVASVFWFYSPIPSTNVLGYSLSTII